jgi:hypothetical protein
VPPGDVIDRLILFRVVGSNPPTLDDFMSSAARGRPLPATSGEVMRLSTGVSMWATIAQARRNARRFSRLGRFIAAVEIEESATMVVERILGRGHYTVWAEPSALLASVRSIEEV